MPAIIPLIPLIISGITAGVALSGAGQPSAPKPTQAPTDTQKPDLTNEKAALLQAAPSVQERLGGSVSPDFFATEVARVSGNPQDTDLAKQVLSQFLGLGDTSAKTTLAESPSIGAGGSTQSFSPFSVSSGRGGAVPNFFEGVTGGDTGGSGQELFTGGFS